jgi:hypothetical protein
MLALLMLSFANSGCSATPSNYAVLKGRTEREIMLVTNELHQRRRNHSADFTVTAQQLAEFLHRGAGKSNCMKRSGKRYGQFTLRASVPPFLG